MSIYDYIKEKEGFHDTAYDDAVGVRTIGYGRTGGSFEPTTREAEDEWLKRRVDSDRRYVQNYAKEHGYNWSPEQMDALSSFVFNLGRGRLDQLTQGGQRDDATIGKKIQLYNKAGGRELPGLVTRRNEEAAMFSGNPGGVPQSTFQSPHTDGPSAQPIPPRVLDEPTFDEAFAQARQAQGAGGEFEWDGNFYTTNYKEEDMQGLFDGTPMVQYLRRGSTVVLDEEEKKRREEARAAGANNTSGGRNEPRTPPAYQDNIVPGLNEPILNDPNSRVPFVTGEEPVLQSDQQRGLVPQTDQGGVPVVDNTSAAVPPVVAGRADVPVGALPAGEPVVEELPIDIVEPRPEGQAGRAWNKKYGKTHNVDGTPKSSQQVYDQKFPEHVGSRPQNPRAAANWDKKYGGTHNPDGTRKSESDIADAEYEAAVEADSVRPRPETGKAQDSWDRTFGDTHNPDGTPKVDPIKRAVEADTQAEYEEASGAGDVVYEDKPIKVEHPSDSPMGQQGIAGEYTLGGDGGATIDDGTGNKSWFPPETVEKVSKVLKDYLGLEGQDIKRAIGMYLLSRASGASHSGSMQWAGQQVYSQAEAREKSETKHFQDLVEKGEYTPESLKAYKESGYDPSLLIPVSQADTLKELGNTQTFFGPKGREIFAREVETADGSKYWVDQNNQPIDTNTHHTDPSRVKDTPQYNKAVREEAKQYTALLDQMRDELDTFETKEGDKRYTKLISGQAGFNIAKFARDNNIPASGMGQLIRNSYDSAIKFSKTTKGKKAESIIPFLNEQYIKSEVGDPSLFVQRDGNSADADKVIELMDKISSHVGLTGSRINNSTQIIQEERKQWLNVLTEEERKRFISKAGPGQSGFMKYLELELQSDVQ